MEEQEIPPGSEIGVTLAHCPGVEARLIEAPPTAAIRDHTAQDHNPKPLNSPPTNKEPPTEPMRGAMATPEAIPTQIIMT